MGLQITHLGSGSRGNSTLLESDSCKVLIDCGFSLKQTEKRLSTIKIEPSSIDAIFITHHHSDHTSGVIDLVKAYPGVKVFSPSELNSISINIISNSN